VDQDSNDDDVGDDVLDSLLREPEGSRPRLNPTGVALPSGIEPVEDADRWSYEIYPENEYYWAEQEGDEEEEVEEEEQPESGNKTEASIDRLVQILGTAGDKANMQERVDRMFEGQGEEMADVKRQVEEKLGLR